MTNGSSGYKKLFWSGHTHSRLSSFKAKRKNHDTVAGGSVQFPPKNSLPLKANYNQNSLNLMEKLTDRQGQKNRTNFTIIIY